MNGLGRVLVIETAGHGPYESPRCSGLRAAWWVAHALCSSRQLAWRLPTHKAWIIVDLARGRAGGPGQARGGGGFRAQACMCLH